MTSYGPQKFLNEYSENKYSISHSHYEGPINTKFTKMASRKNMKIFRRYLEYFINIAYESDIKIEVQNKKNVKCYKFACTPYEFQLLVPFRADFKAANNKWGMEKVNVIDRLTIEVVEKTENIETKYGKLDIINKYNRLFKKFVKKICKFIQKDIRMNAWFILQGINPIHILDNINNIV